MVYADICVGSSEGRQLSNDSNAWPAFVSLTMCT